MFCSCLDFQGFFCDGFCLLNSGSCFIIIIKFFLLFRWKPVFLVLFQAEAASDEVYAQVSLLPESEVGDMICSDFLLLQIIFSLRCSPLGNLCWDWPIFMVDCLFEMMGFFLLTLLSYYFLLMCNIPAGDREEIAGSRDRGRWERGRNWWFV